MCVSVFANIAAGIDVPKPDDNPTDFLSLADHYERIRSKGRKKEIETGKREELMKREKNKTNNSKTKQHKS